MRRGARAAAGAACFALVLCLTACDGDDLAGFLEAAGEVYDAVGHAQVSVPQDEWYWAYRREMHPGSFAGEAVLDLGATAFTLQDLTSAWLLTEPVESGAGLGRPKSVMCVAGRAGAAGLFAEPAGAEIPGLEHNARYPGMVDGDLFRRAPMDPAAVSGSRALMTAYAWEAGAEPLFLDVSGYAGGHPDTEVLWRMTAVYDGLAVMPAGFILEAQSLDGGLCLCRYVYNVQPGVAFDYMTGRNWLEAAGDPEAAADGSEVDTDG